MLSETNVLNDSMSESDEEEEVKIVPKKYDQSKWFQKAKSTITNGSMKFDIE